jgi:DNA-binding SARP family transcriptional activator
MQYRMLGPLEVVDGSRKLDLGAPKQRAVLGVLLLDRGRVVPADRIISAVWGDVPPPSVSASLQAYISNLRRVLRDETGLVPIGRRSPGYVLDVQEDLLDRSAFLALTASARDAVGAADWATAVDTARRGLALWRGPVLADLKDEAWVQVDASALDEQRAETREHLITGLLGLDRTGEAVAEAAHLVEEAPLREHAAWLHAVALYRAGRSVEALDLYRVQAKRLDDELGLEAPAALRDLHGAMLRQAPELSTWPRAEARRAASVPIDPGVVTTDGLVGRRRELATIEDLFRAPRVGARWLVLTGPAGIGKTRLAEETLAAAAADGMRVIRTGCPEDDGTPPWWPVRQLLRGLHLDAEALLTPPPDTGADVGRFVVYERLAEALSRVGSAVVLVDDAHWADPSSLRWLTHLAETAQADAFDLVLTVREGIESPDLERLLAAIARHPGARQLAIPPLDVVEVGALASLVSGEDVEPAEAGVLAAQTGGNPFFVGEYARLPREEREAGGVPVAVRFVLRRRLAAVDTEVLQVLRTAAVAGDQLDVELLRTVTRLDHDELADLLDDAAERDLIAVVPDGSGYRFSHGLLRDEVLAGLSAPRRQRLHVRIAEALRDAPGTDGLVRRASHLLAALPLAPAAEVYAACRAAAVDAESRWESEAAAEWWAAASSAYALLPAAEQTDEERDDLLVARVTALGRAGRRQTVIGVVTEALLEAVRADRLSSAGRLAAVTLRTSGNWPWTAFTVDPGPLLTRLAGIEPLVRVDPGAHARVLAALAVGNYYDADPGVPDRLSARAVDIAERVADPDVLADALLGRALVLSGISSRARELVAVVARLDALPHRQERIDGLLVHDLLTLALMTLGDIDGVEHHLREGIAASDALRLPVVRVQLRWVESCIAHWHGDLERAEQLAVLAAQAHRRTELYIMNVDGFSALTRYWEQGRITDRGTLRSEDNPAMPWLRAALLLADGRDDEALTVLTGSARRPPREVWSTIGETTIAAHLVADRGLVPAARPMLEVLTPFRGMIASFGQTGEVGVVSVALARLHAMIGETDAARELVAEARDLAERGRGLPSILRCRLVSAQLDGASHAELDSIAVEAARIGMTGIARDADSLRSREHASG